MRRWSLHVATIGGTEVRIHATFLLLLILIGLEGLGQGGVAAAWEALVFVVAMFLCVLLHEFGHVLAARRYGIKTPDITLLPIGGLARLERMPRKPEQELVVAIAGPAVNVAIALLIFLWLQIMPSPSLDFSLVEGPLAVRLMQWNIVMVLFNMIPAFPMDGGRVLRASLALVLDYGTATRWAASIGQGIAIAGGMIALFVLGKPLLVIIAVFIFFSAGQEASYVSGQEATRGLRVADAMVTQFNSLRKDQVLQDAVDLLLAGTQHDFPVVDYDGAFAGMLSRHALISALAAHGPRHLVGDVMETCETTLLPTHSLGEAMDQLRISRCPALPVIHPARGNLAGLLTAENVGEVLMVRAALGQS